MLRWLKTLSATVLRLALVLGTSLLAPALVAAQGAKVNPETDWPMAARDYANTRYSPLSQIGAANVKDIRIAFTFSTGALRGHEAAPVIVGSTMYIVTPYPNYLYALDLAQPGAPMKWKFEPKPSASAQGVACCDVVNRGVAYADGKIFMNTLDTQTIAVATARSMFNAVGMLRSPQRAPA